MGKFSDLMKSHPLVLVDFYADWCGPCKAMAPELEKLKKHYGEQIKIVKINTEKNKAISAQYNIRSIPTLMIFKNGKQQKVKAGGMILPQLKQFIEPYL